MPIVDLPTFKAYVRDDLTGADDDVLTGSLLAAERAINEGCQRAFTLATTATTRLYVPTSACVLRIHDCTSVTSVMNDGTTIATSGYQLEPLNNISWSGEARPFEQIRLLDDFWVFDRGEATASITATWGWSAIPYPIVEAVKILAKDIAYQREMKGSIAGFGEFGAVRMRENATVQALIAPYRRVESWGIA